MDELEPKAEAEAAGSARRMQQLESQVARQQEMIRWLETELESVHRSITWRGTEPVRQVYARVQALQRALEKGSSETAGIVKTQHAAHVEAETAAFAKDDPAQWTPEAFAQAAAQPISPVTDIIVCVGRELRHAERCIESIRRHTDQDTYRLSLVVHEDDLAGLTAQAKHDARLITHTMQRFNFARANNIALQQCAGAVVLLNDDTEVTGGWLEQLRADSRGIALAGSRTGVRRSGNPDTWGSGESRLTWYPINMFCAFIPDRVRQVVGALDEEFAYYGGEDVDYSARVLQHGFPLVVSSAFVEHVGAQSFRSRKEGLMRESDKILRERYGVHPPFDLAQIRPLVSVIIATRNRGATLAEAAESILSGQYPEIELLVVDDCSTDDTPAVVAALQESDQRVIGIRLPKRQGSVKARARGFAASAGQFVAFMDDDDIAWPNRIAAPLRHFMMYPDLDVVYCAFEVITERGRQRGRTQPFSEADYLDEKFDIGAGILLVRRQVLHEVPFMTHYERAVDFDWVFRVLRHGFRIGYCPSVVLDYNRAGPEDTHLAGNEAAMRMVDEIRERERLIRQLERK